MTMTSSPQTAEDLCELAQAGDAAAASELLAGHYERIFAYFRRSCGNDADAADLTQKTFIKVWASLASFSRRSTFSTWIHGIARFVYLDACRERKFLSTESDEWWEVHAADGPSPFESAAEKEAAHRLYAAVMKLETDTREVVHLHYYQGLSLRETAEVLQIATSTVKYRLRQALEILKSNTHEQRPGKVGTP